MEVPPYKLIRSITVLVLLSLSIVQITWGQIVLDSTQTNSMRYSSGIEELNNLAKEGISNIIKNLEDIAPEFGDHIVAYAYGDIYSNSSLSVREKQIAIIAALTVKGHALPQLKFHIKAGLNIGLLKKEIKDVIVQMSVYAGFPETLNALMLLKEIVEDRD